MGSYGVKYAISGKDITKVSDAREIGYSSIYNTLKTHKQGQVSVSVNAASSATKEIAHGLNYRPAFNAYFRDTSNGEIYQVMSGFETVSFNRSGAEVAVHASSNNYNLVFYVYNNSGATKGVDIFYEIFIEDLVSEPIVQIG